MANIPVDHVIENDVPIPVEVSSRVMPLRGLEVGQSILFPRERERYVRTKAARLKKSEGLVYTVHVVDEKHARVWRTA